MRGVGRQPPPRETPWHGLHRRDRRHIAASQGSCGGLHPFPGRAHPMIDRSLSHRVSTIQSATPFHMLYDFFRLSGYEQRRHEPGVLDFTFGDPHDPPAAEYVQILREATVPQHELWFAYLTGHPEAVEAAAASLRRHLGLPFRADDVHLTTGGFAAISAALKVV